MVRMQIQFSVEQSNELRRRARERGVSIASIVREAVDHELSRRESLEDAWRRSLAAVGTGHGDGTNVGERHDEFLAEAFAHD